MSKTRILGGFSLVEMMLLLLITSLMLASSVTLITKKHVKVPKITMHGAYMCYMKNGVLHEEQYVGSGLRKKTKDQDVAQCKFIPPARTSYLHIQAIGGGGGGGDSGYTGGKIETFESQTEVISPFGITQGLLDLKGISNAELSKYGGNLYAYAKAEGAGRGGDLYYIKSDCNNTCIQYREWEYKGDRETSGCYCRQKTDYYNVSHYYYDLWDNCANSCYVPCTHTCWDTCWTTCYETCYDKQVCNWADWDCRYYTGGTCYDSEGNPFTCGYNEVNPHNCRPYSCSYDCNPHKCHSSDWVTSASQCGTHVCNRITGNCESYTKPTSSFSDVWSSLNVYADDRYTQDWRDPKRMYETAAATGGQFGVRNVERDEQIAKAICNYGNTTKFTGVSDGVFGTFADGEVPVACNTNAIMAAFGEDIYPLGGGSTVFTEIVTKSSQAVYGGEGIKYDKSEESNAYGERCVNDAENGDCGDYEMKYNVPGVYKSLKTSYKVTYGSDSYNSCPSRSSYDSGSVSYRYNEQRSTSNYGNGSAYCTCPRYNSEGRECVTRKYLCAYYAAKATGGNGGAGTQCRTNDMRAGLGLTYVGNSSVVPGIRGSDKNCTGAGYKALYEKNEYESQPSCYAENGTNAVGSSTVTMSGNGTNSCTANYVAPTMGKGARKTSTGATTGTNGTHGTNGQTNLRGATNGAGCGDQHVGYCLRRYGGGVNENGKYTYKYTWDTNYLQYGEGGKAGQYRAMIIRSFDGVELPITLGQGGAGGTPESGNAGEDGTATIVGDIVRAEGGVGGPGGKLTPTEQLPVWYPGGVFQKGKNGTPGESANIANFKANILNLILPVDNSILGQWLAASGAGGDGGGSRNTCWASEWVRWFEGQEVVGNQKVHAEDITCRNTKYGFAEPNATSGTPGAVLIRW